MFRWCSATVMTMALVWGGVVLSVAPPASAADATSIEAETMRLSTTKGAKKIVTDPTASGGTALGLTGAVTLSATLALPQSVKIVMRSRGGLQCFGGAPVAAVIVDGVVIGRSPITATAWTDYTATANIPAGTHTIGIKFANPQWFFCVRALYIDTVSIVASTTTQPGDRTQAPVADLPGWKHIVADNFTKDAPLGSWANPPSDPAKVVYVGDGGTQWLTYPQTFTDTYQHRPYRPPDQVLSVGNGTLDYYLHNVDGQPAGANPSPILPNGTQYQTYGRYSVRLKADTATLAEYHIAFLLWPQSELWPSDGEEDFPRRGGLVVDRQGVRALCPLDRRPGRSGHRQAVHRLARVHHRVGARTCPVLSRRRSGAGQHQVRAQQADALATADRNRRERNQQRSCAGRLDFHLVVHRKLTPERAISANGRLSRCCTPSRARRHRRLSGRHCRPGFR